MFGVLCLSDKKDNKEPIPDLFAEEENKMAQKRDPYEVLNITKAATKAEVEKAFNSFAIKYHPDRMLKKSDAEKKEAAAKYSEAGEARDILKDDKKRAVYDAHGFKGLEDLAAGKTVSTSHQFQDVINKIKDNPVRPKLVVTEDSAMDFFDRSKAERTSGGPSTTAAPYDPNSAAAARAARRASLKGTAPEAPAPVAPVEKPTTPTTPTAKVFTDTAAKVQTTVETLTPANMALVPLDALVQFRQNLSDLLDTVDASIAVAKKGPAPKR